MRNKKERPVGPYPKDSHVRCVYSRWVQDAHKSDVIHLRCSRCGCNVNPDNGMCELGVRLDPRHALRDKSEHTVYCMLVNGRK